jgi:hypothetical protein
MASIRTTTQRNLVRLTADPSVQNAEKQRLVRVKLIS